MAFFASAIDTLKILVIALGAGLGAWGVINLLEGYGNDNPGAKSQGMKQLMEMCIRDIRSAINAVFDEIVADLKREQILTHSDVTLPLPVQPLAENEQISIFTADRPSVMAQLAAAKPAEKTTPAQAAPKKSRAPEI